MSFGYFCRHCCANFLEDRDSSELDPVSSVTCFTHNAHSQLLPHVFGSVQVHTYRFANARGSEAVQCVTSMTRLIPISPYATPTFPPRMYHLLYSFDHVIVLVPIVRYPVIHLSVPSLLSDIVLSSGSTVRASPSFLVWSV